MNSVCCNAPTRLGYYNASQRPDIHGVSVLNVKHLIAIGVAGTYCSVCGKLCDFKDDKGNEYYTNGIMKKEKVEYLENYIG